MKMEQKTHTHQFSGHLSGTTQVSRYQKGKTNLDLTEARDSEWQWNQLGHMQVCTLLQTDNHASTAPMEQKKMEKKFCDTCRNVWPAPVEQTSTSHCHPLN